MSWSHCLSVTRFVRVRVLSVSSPAKYRGRGSAQLGRLMEEDSELVTVIARSLQQSQQ